nr:unnamed protein product [Callosobruchus analis]
MGNYSKLHGNYDNRTKVSGERAVWCLVVIQEQPIKMEINSKAGSLAAILFDLDNTLIATRTADETTCEKIHLVLNS